MWWYILYLVAFVLWLYNSYVFRYKLYEDHNCSEKILIPIGFYFIGFILMFIPFLNIIVDIILYVILFKSIQEEDFYYNAGWFINFLNKEI